MPPDQPRGVDASASAPLLFAPIMGVGCWMPAANQVLGEGAAHD